MVGPSVGQFNGGLANRGDPVSAQEYGFLVDMCDYPGVC